MAKGGFMKALPFLGGAAALAAPFLAPALFGAEAAGLGGAEAAGLGAEAAAGAPEVAAATTAGIAPEVAGAITLPDVTVTAPAFTAGEAAGAAGGAAAGASPFLIPGTNTPLPSGGTDLGALQTIVPGNDQFLIPGTDTPISGGVPSIGTSAGVAGPSSSNLLGTAGGLSGPSPNSVVNTLVSNLLPTPSSPNDPGGLTSGATDLPIDLYNQALLDPTDPYATGLGRGYDPATATAATPGGGAGDTMSKVGDWIAKNTGALVAAGGLGLSAMMNRQPIPGTPPISNIAGTANTNAANLMTQANQNLGAFNTGAIPAGAQSAIDQAANSAKATIRSQFANMGITGPYSGEGEALASVDQNAAAQKLSQMQNLVNLGANEAGLAQGQEGLASQDYVTLMNAYLRQQTDLQNALSRFAGAFAGPALRTTTTPTATTDVPAAA